MQWTPRKARSLNLKLLRTGAILMVGLQGWSRYIPSRYMDAKFDRRTFNPETHADHKQTLMTLRRQGERRARDYTSAAWHAGRHDKNHFACCGSTALRNLSPYDFVDYPARAHCDDPTCASCREVYLDLGAGDSPDVLIASSLGYNAYSVDLFPPFRYGPVCNAFNKSERTFYIKADAVELPFADNSADYISSQAMAALLTPADRTAFYHEVRRVLKIGGVFSLTGCTLRCGYQWNQGREVRRAETLQWEVYSSNTGFVAQRVD